MHTETVDGYYKNMPIEKLIQIIMVSDIFHAFYQNIDDNEDIINNNNYHNLMFLLLDS